MKYYLDITLLPDAEANLGFLWEKVYQQIHLALVENKIAENQSKIAVSFPKYGDKEFPLGNILRLFAETKEQLEALNVQQYLQRLLDYTHCKSIQAVDINKIEKHVCFTRKAFKSPTKMLKDIDRRAKYQENKSVKSFDEIKQGLLKKHDDKCKLPFINLISLSSKPSVDLFEKDRYQLFIDKCEVDSEIKGVFTCYGLSIRKPAGQTTVPWF